MELYCTRPGCSRPVNVFPDLDDSTRLKTTQQKFCTACGMPLILVGRYLPMKLLGRGGFGAAFLARDRYTPAMRLCVVKQFQPSGNLTPDQLQLAQKLFEREGEVLESLGTHPQIPDLLAFFPLDVPGRMGSPPDQFFYLVQEFIDGQNLEEELAQKQCFSEAEVIDLLEHLLPVLKFVHSSGSIHRDIKPSNIMRRRDGLLFLLDFGAVKQVAAAPAASGRGSTGIYSMGFAPPEQMHGDTVYPATDLYALAVTCLTLLTGREPKDLYDAYSNTWNWRAYAQVSDRLEAVLNRMLLPTPNQRFQSADEVMAALKQPVRPTPAPPPAPPAPTPQSRHTATQAPVPTPAPVPAPTPTPAPTRPRRVRSPFSTLELLGNAAFTGFETGLIAVAAASLLGTTLITPSLWLGMLGVLGGLVLAQSLRWIEKIDLLIIAAITFVVVFLFPPLHATLPAVSGLNPWQTLLVLAGFAALLMLVVAIMFRLIYNLLSRLF